jgi:ribosomal protein S18 acetylase RimI-like enzyme
MDYRVTPLERHQRDVVLDLLFYSRRHHTQLDWQSAGRWLEQEGNAIALAWHDEQLVGVMGISAPLFGTAWVRLLAVHDAHDPKDILPLLWRDLCQQTTARAVYWLVVQRWVMGDLPALGFRYQEDVVMMSRVGATLPPMSSARVSIHNAYLEHVADLVRVDHAAFPPEWRMTTEELRHAQRHATSCTMAVDDDGAIVGYQLSTRHQNTAHLARLAVLPAQQGLGVGAALLQHMIESYLRRGVNAVSVNTQASNTRSQALYTRYGFVRNGYDLPVWRCAL